jgi:cellulose biosynthesis protein BcsQ
MTRVFVLTNHKGGVGKTTSATTIALGITGVLRQAGAPNSRVLLVDTDSPEQSLVRQTNFRPDAHFRYAAFGLDRVPLPRCAAGVAARCRLLQGEPPR